MDNKLLIVVLDGVGHRRNTQGNAVLAARTPTLDYLAKEGVFTTLKAHGTWVGMPADDDLGNSEVGHTTLGAGRVFDQGAKLVNKALADKSMFAGETWQGAVKNVREHDSTLHFIGLLSDGNVHSHQRHLHEMIGQAKRDGVQRVRVHALLDGRDVGERSAHTYIDSLEKNLANLRGTEFDASIASCGGRMRITMDRYEADWQIVKRGWDLHVLGKGRKFATASAGIETLRKETRTNDQFMPEFLVDVEHGRVIDNDSVIFFNFRGDRAIQISQAFSDPHLKKFARPTPPRVFFAGMMEYDGDRKIPPHYLVTPPRIDDTLTTYLLPLEVRQFACSESQKYGHVTYFWNGNRAGYIDRKLEEYLEIPSNKDLRFDLQPWMQAFAITEATLTRIKNDGFDFARINFPNGDMVGHTGNYESAVLAVAIVDMMLGHIVTACREHNVNLLVTADHGNCDEMFEFDDPQLPKTSHTLSEVPFYFYDPQRKLYKLREGETFTLANVANTALEVLGIPQNKFFHDSILHRA